MVKIKDLKSLLRIKNGRKNRGFSISYTSIYINSIDETFPHHLYCLHKQYVMSVQSRFRGSTTSYRQNL